MEENESLRREINALKRQLALPPEPEPEQMSKFAGIKQAQYVSTPHFYYPQVESAPPVMPCFRIMDDLGRVVGRRGARAHPARVCARGDGHDDPRLRV